MLAVSALAGCSGKRAESAAPGGAGTDTDLTVTEGANQFSRVGPVETGAQEK